MKTRMEIEKMNQTVIKDFSVSNHKKTIKLEYRFYFAIIFLMSLLPASVGCLFGVLRSFQNSNVIHESIISRAWGNARVITPMIFSA
jgi:hypothetical protein